MGDSRTDKGTWSIAGDTITLKYTHVGKHKEELTKLASISEDKLTLNMPALDGDVTAVLVRKTFPPWVGSIIALFILIIFWVIYANWVMYARRDNPNVKFSVGAPELVIGIATVCLVTGFILGIVGVFKPEVLVWAEEAASNIDMFGYFGFLAIGVVSVILWVVEERRVKNVLWIVLALVIVALLVWLYLRFGIEVSIEGG